MTKQFLTPIQLPADPTNPMEAATKQYVDNNGGGTLDALHVGTSAPSDPDIELWYDTDEEFTTDPRMSIPTAAKSGRTQGVDNVGPTSGTTEYVYTTMTTPIFGVPGTVHVWGTVATTISVTTDRFIVSVRVDGSTTVSSVRGHADHSGLAGLPTFTPTGSFTTAGTATHTIAFGIARNTGTGTATLVSGGQSSSHWIFIPTGGATSTDLSGLDARYASQSYVNQISMDVVPEPNRYAAVGGQATTLTPNGNDLLFLPVRAPAGNIDALAAEVTTAGATNSVLRLGIYTSHATRLEPYDLLYDAGTISSTTTGVKAITFSSVAFPGGWLWLAVAVQGAPATNPTLRAVTGFGEPWTLFGVGQTPVGLSLLYRTWVVSASGALPNPVGSLGLTVVANPKIAYRIA